MGGVADKAGIWFCGWRMSLPCVQMSYKFGRQLLKVTYKYWYYIPAMLTMMTGWIYH